MKSFKRGGIHPPSEKISKNTPIKRISPPEEIVLYLNQSIGRAAIPIVKVGDEVKRGQKVADPDGMVSAPIHSPIGGKIKKIEKVRTPQGEWANAIIISNDGNVIDDDLLFPMRSEAEIKNLSAIDIKNLIGEAGIVGLGGAAFPTKVKLSPPPGQVLNCVILNGAECEPFLTCDDRLMREKGPEIIKGLQLLMRGAEVEKGYIGIEDNKPESIEAMRVAASKDKRISVVPLKTKYPQGGEKEMIEAILGIEVPAGALPASVGVIVDNVATAYAVYEAIWRNKPLIERVVTVTSPITDQSFIPSNFLAPVGVPLSYLISQAGGDFLLSNDFSGEIICGGPMMGKGVSNPDAVTFKASSGILILLGKGLREEQPCIRCGRCVSVCPMGLEPYLLLSLSRNSLWTETREEDVPSCIECGSCAYTCPSNKPLLDFIRLAKSEVRKL